MSGPEDGESASTWKRVGRFFLDWLKSLGLYLLVVTIGTLLFLIGASIVGYLAYSDRPGPGWGRGVLSWTEVKFFVGWLPLLIYCLLFQGATLFPFARLLGWFHSPRWLMCVSGGVFASIAALIGILSAGWYIAISQYPVCAGALCGTTYGAVLLPRFSGAPRAGQQRGWKQWAGIASTIIACGVFVAYPLVPKQSEQSLEVIFVRVIPGPQDLAATEKTGGLTAYELGQLKTSGLSGTIHFGMSQFRGSTPTQARVVIVCTGDLGSPVKLPEPRGTHVMYVQNGNAWNTYPPGAPMSRNKIKFWPSATDPRMVEVQSGSSHSTFSWYPPLDYR
jgi:hypothetical protein